MADHSVSGGAGSPARRDDLEPELEAADPGAGQPGDGQGRRYAHTLRRSGAANTPPCGVPATAAVPVEARDIAADARDSARHAVPRITADPRDSARHAVPRITSADPRDSARHAVPQIAAADPRDSARHAMPRVTPAAPRDSARHAVPRITSADPRDSAKIVMSRLAPADLRDSAKIVMSRLAPADPRDGAQHAVPRVAPGDPPDSAKIVMSELPLPEPRDIAAIDTSRPSRPVTVPPIAAPAGPGAANPPRAPTDSTALYRRRNSRPETAAEPPPDEASPGRILDAESSSSPGGEDLPSRLPSVMLDADPRRMALLRAPRLEDLPSLGQARLALPIAVVVVVGIAAWLLRSML